MSDVMNFIWEDTNFGYHRGVLLDNDDKEITRITIKELEENCFQEIVAKYEVYYSHGYSMREYFDDSMSLEDVKVWCEDYILDKYINAYENLLKRLEEVKEKADWVIAFKENRNTDNSTEERLENHLRKKMYNIIANSDYMKERFTDVKISCKEDDENANEVLNEILLNYNKQQLEQLEKAYNKGMDCYFCHGGWIENNEFYPKNINLGGRR